jgi:hypothetical protein
MKTPSSAQSGHRPQPTTDHLTGVNVTVDVGDNRTLPPRLAHLPPRRYPPPPLPTGPIKPEDLAGVMVTVECTGDMTFRPRPKPPGDEKDPAV